LPFNCCRTLARHNDGLGASAIARLLDEYGFHQTSHSIGSAMRKLVRLGIVTRIEARYKLVHPTACGKVWLLCL
jgi:repressor of nif and glnA expression